MDSSSLTRSKLRRLAVGESVSERGVTYTRLAGDGRWSVNVMVNRVRHHLVVGLESEGFTKTQAEAVVAALKAKKREASHGVPAPKHRARLSLARAAPIYLEHLSTHGGKDIEGKRGRFERHLVRLLGHVDLARLTELDWQRYTATRVAEGAAPGTINREQAALLHLLRTLVRTKDLAAVPCSLSKLREPDGKVIYLLPDQLQLLLAAAEEDESPHAVAFVMIGAFTGMRQSPILNLRVRDVDFDRLVLWVGRDKAGQREQPMPRVLADYLRGLTTGRAPDDYLFPSKKAKSGRVYQINSIFRRCADRAGLPRSFTPHTLRHTMASNAAHAGLDAATIQGLGGWKTRQMAERYTHAARMATAMEAVQSRLQGRTIAPELQRPPEKRT